MKFVGRIGIALAIRFSFNRRALYFHRRGFGKQLASVARA